MLHTDSGFLRNSSIDLGTGQARAQSSTHRRRSRHHFMFDMPILDSCAKPRLDEPAIIIANLFCRLVGQDNITQPCGYEKLECITADATRVQPSSFEIRCEFCQRVSLIVRRNLNGVSSRILPHIKSVWRNKEKKIGATCTAVGKHISSRLGSPFAGRSKLVLDLSNGSKPTTPII